MNNPFKKFRLWLNRISRKREAKRYGVPFREREWYNYRAARDQHSYMYHGAILNTLLDDLDRLTHNVLAFKAR